VKLPSRRFPGILVQGDSYFILLSEITKAMDLISANETAEAYQILEDVAEGMQHMLGYYEDALKENGIALPYFKQKS